MEIFDLRNNLVKDYADYIQSFFVINDQCIRQHVDDNFGKGLLWTDPHIQLNPTFARGEWIDELVKQNILHEEYARMFRLKEHDDGEGKALRLHREIVFLYPY